MQTEHYLFHVLGVTSRVKFFDRKQSLSPRCMCLAPRGLATTVLRHLRRSKFYVNIIPYLCYLEELFYVVLCIPWSVVNGESMFSRREIFLKVICEK